MGLAASTKMSVIASNRPSSEYTSGSSSISETGAPFSCSRSANASRVSVVIGRAVEDGGMRRTTHAVGGQSAGRGCRTKRRSGQPAAIFTTAACGVSPVVKKP